VVALVGQVFEGECKINDTTPLGPAVEKIKTHTAFSYATQLVVLDADGRWSACRGHDVGRAINPVLCSAQVEGSVHMGLGYALSEDFACDERGWPVDPTMRGIGVHARAPRAPHRGASWSRTTSRGPFGAKGVGEIGLVPTAGAVAGATRRSPAACPLRRPRPPRFARCSNWCGGDSTWRSTST
jgi:CO/xanthine dehydrogenase Mo-binding subunit